MKRKQVTKFMALLMSLVLGSTAVPANVWAAEVATQEYELSDEWEQTATEAVYEAEGYKVRFVLTDSWDGGYNANVEIENTGEFVIHNWYIGFYCDNAFTGVWNAEVDSYEDGLYIIKNAGWNQDIAPGQMVSFGISCNENFAGFPNEYEILGASVSMAEEDYAVEYQLDSSWENGFNGTVTVTNLTDVAIEDWSLSFDFERTITNIWNANIVENEDNHYIISNSGYNGSIAPGGTVSFGFGGENGAEADVPYNYELFSYKLYDMDEEVIDENTDTDSDGIPDYMENYFGTDVTKVDTDEDGLSDYLEVMVLITDPLLADTDGNSVNDGDEDLDGDGCSNLQELEWGTDPVKADTDSDGLTDYDEYAVYHTEFLQYDTDEDGACDGVEIQLGTEPTVRDETFSISVKNEDTDELKVTVEAVVAGEQIETLNIKKFEDDTLFPETMPGYIGNAYALDVEGELNNAVISFEFDPALVSGNDVVPTIYGLYEEMAVLEELSTTITDNIASAEVGMFSKYILLDRTVFEESKIESQKVDRNEDLRTDSDEDGIADYYEENMVLFNGTPIVLDKDNADSDGDGVNDSEEIATMRTFAARGSDAVGTVLMMSNPLAADSDYDGQPDSMDAAPFNNSFTGKLQTEYATSTVKFNMDYRWFFKDNTVYNSDLSKTSILLSSAVYNENSLSIQDSVNTNTTTGKDINSVLQYLGMSATKSVALNSKYNDIHVSEVGLGYRTVNYNGQEKNIVAVVVRGTNGTIQEWSSNFEIGDSSKYYTISDWITKNNHAGFDIAANRIMKEVTQYVSDNGLNASNTVYWITGHSRGAAIANIIGAYYESANKTAFTYTFATPNTTLATNAANYKTIFNIVNEDDLVPYMPMNAWGYGRYGQTANKSLSSYEKEWENLTDIFDYNPDTFGLLDTVDSLSGIVGKDARVNCYKYTCSHHGDGSSNNITITNYGMSKKSREGAIAKIPANALPYCKITRYNGFLCAGWNFDVCQPPAYFMQILAAVMGNNISAYRFTVELNIADRYEDAKSAIIASYLGGVEHPHYTESYYVIANHVSANDF